MLFEYALNGDLTNFMAQHGSLSKNMVRFLSAHIINGLDYLRRKQVVHRDLKPANIVLNEMWQPLLADFGTAKTMLSDCLSSPSMNSEMTISDNVSYISATSAISDISAGQSALSSIDCSDFRKQFYTPQNQMELSESEEEDSEDDEIIGTAAYVSPEMIKT